jgi:ribonuclease-3
LNDTLQALSQLLGHSFRNPALLALALTHRSKSGTNNERLEFLGDSVLSFIIADALYERFPQLSEGDLTRVRATLVRQETLSRLARELELGNYLQLGGGELKSGGFDRDSILADALEAIFGAVYRDGGMSAVSAVVVRIYQPIFEQIDPKNILKDPKTRLQEHLQKRGFPPPVYEVLDISGEAHQQHFIVQCRVAELESPIRGEGSSRRYAEQAAAALACQQLGCDTDG